MPLLLVGLCFTVLWLLTVPVGDFPLNDDWIFAAAAKSILDTGRFTMPGASAANVLVQAYWGALFCLPFGFSFDALRVSTFVLGIVGVLATYGLLRELGAGRALAALGALTLAGNPLYLQLSASFMTDVPFTALLAVSLWMYCRGGRREQAGWLVAAYVVAVLAILIRQFGLVLPLGFGVAHLLRRGFGLRSLAVAVLPLCAGAALHLGFQRWMIATGRTTAFISPISDLVHVRPGYAVARIREFLLLMLPYFGLFVVPFFPAVLAARRWGGTGRVFWLASLVLGAGLLALLWIKQDALPAFGNVLLPYGLGPLTLRDTYILHRNLPVVPGAALFWTAATIVSAWLTVVLLMLGARVLVAVLGGLLNAERRRAAWQPGLLLTVVVAYVGGVLALTLLAQSFERYLVVLIVPLTGLLVVTSAARPLAERRSWLTGLSAVLVGAFALLSVLATHDYLAWNRARWAAARALAQQGVPPSQIDGGYEFNGRYLYRPDYTPTAEKSYWWTQDDTYVIASGPLDGFETGQRFGFSHWLWPAEYSVFILKRK